MPSIKKQAIVGKLVGGHGLDQVHAHDSGSLCPGLYGHGLYQLHARAHFGYQEPDPPLTSTHTWLLTILHLEYSLAPSTSPDPGSLKYTPVGVAASCRLMPL